MSVPTVDAIAELRASVAGPVLALNDGGYFAARAPFNALVERRPAGIAQCLSVGDVVAALDFAGGANLAVGLRGGGGNFGVATRLDFRLHPVDDVIGGMLVYAAAGAREVMRVFRDAMAFAPDHFTMQAMLGRDPDTATAIAAVIVCNSDVDYE